MMQPLQAHLNQTSTFGQSPGSGVRPAIRFGAEDSGKPENGKDRADISQQPSDSTKLVVANQAEDGDSKKPERGERHNFRLAQGLFFNLGVPLLAIGLWPIVPPIGVAAGVGLSYVSGRISRRIMEKVDDSQLSSTALHTKELVNAFEKLDKANNKDEIDQVEGEIFEKTDEVLESLFSPAKLAAIPFIGRFLASSGMVVQGLKTVRMAANNGMVARAARGYVKSRTATAGAAVAGQGLKTGLKGASRGFILLSAIGANHKVAKVASQESSNIKGIPKAGWAFASHLLLLGLIGGALKRFGGSGMAGKAVQTLLKDKVPQDVFKAAGTAAKP